MIPSTRSLQVLAALRVLLPLINVAGLVLVASRRRLLRIVREGGGDSADKAVPLEATGIKAWWLKRLERAGVLKRTSSGRYWLDREAYRLYRRERLVRVLVVLVIVVIIWVFYTTTCCGR